MTASVPSYKTILVHLDESPQCAVRVTFAAQLAQAHGAHLVGLAVASAERARALTSEFEASARALGVASCEGRGVDDEPTGAIVRHGRTADLIVLGQYDPDAKTSVGRGSAEDVILDSGRPVLLIPFVGRYQVPHEHALIAWRGTREAAVAIRDALPLLVRCKRTTLMRVLGAGEAQPPLEAELTETVRWLQRHGAGTVEVYDTHSHIDPGNVLLSRASDIGADLLIMGGYGHSRLREVVLGGVTRGLLEQMTLPVLMSH